MMREVTIVSGKGGTGKTSVTAAFAKLASESGHRAVVCDLDVDAADLHLLLHPDILETTAFSGGKVAALNEDMCTACGVCQTSCRFGAIAETDDGIQVDAELCEGCGVCARFCRKGAIAMVPRVSGRWFRSRTALGPMLHAELFPGEENSGLLVSRLREAARAVYDSEACDLVLADGPPGIGCPVVSAISGTGFVVIVTEPTVSGFHDFRRIADLCDHFQRPVGVVLNKADLDPAIGSAIHEACRVRGYAYLAEIPYSTAVVRGLIDGCSLDEIATGGVSTAIAKAWDGVAASLENLPNKGIVQ